MTPAEIALIVALSEGGVTGQYQVCIDSECASYEGTGMPSAYPYKGGIRVVTPGQPWTVSAGSVHNCRDYGGSSQHIINTGHIVNRICGYDDGFSIFFMEE